MQSLVVLWRAMDEGDGWSHQLGVEAVHLPLFVQALFMSRRIRALGDQRLGQVSDKLCACDCGVLPETTPWYILTPKRKAP